MELIGYIFGGFCILFLIYQQARLIYNRYLRAYKIEIKSYLDNKGFEYKETLYPNEKEWSKAPFSKPPRFKVGFVLIKINGTFVTWTSKDYLIVQGQKKDKIQEFWLEISTTYFRRPTLTFREGRSIRNKESETNKDIKFIKVGEKCPACGFKLSTIDKLCPDCGLNFE